MLVSSALASPFLVCDPQPGVTQYKVSYDGCATFQAGIVPAQPDGSIRLDLASFPPGNYKFCLEAMDGQGKVSDPSNALDAYRHNPPGNLHFGE